MGTDVNEVMEVLPSPNAIKVHRLICTKLIELINGVSEIFPQIEAARPRCSSGIEALCLLNKAITKAKLLTWDCCESSKLYLALNGQIMLLRCERSRSLMEQSLNQLQNMVPVMLAAEVSRTISDLRVAKFSLDTSEEEAGNVLRELLHQYDSATDFVDEPALRAIRVVASRLHITSPKALLIEKRSIKKLLDRVGKANPPKRKILLFFLSLLNKYGDSIVKELTENDLVQLGEPSQFGSSNGQSVEVETHLKRGAKEDQIDRLSSLPPEEFKCPLSSRLMYDPVVISSGQTFERTWIQKWFSEGHDTCPKTKRKLSHLSMTPNTVMKDLISRWCTLHEVTIPDPSMPIAVHPMEISSTSIASLSNSMNNLTLPIDFGNLTVGRSDASQSLDSINIGSMNYSDMQSMTCDDSDRFQHVANIVDLDAVSKLHSLPWKSQCSVIEDIQSVLCHVDQATRLISTENFVQPLLGFLRDAYELNDVDAQRDGCLLLLSLVKKYRSRVEYFDEDIYGLLALLVDSKVGKEALPVLEVLSCHSSCINKIAASGALTSVVKKLDNPTREFLEPALKILCNISENGFVNSLTALPEFVPKLVPFLEDTALAGYCITILKNLCDNEKGRVSVAESDGCIGSVVKLIEDDCHEDQENAVSVLLSICSQHIQYCQLVMHEGVIPGLCSVSVNGNKKGKAMALELLRLLRDIKNDDNNNNEECSASDIDAPMDLGNNQNEGKSSSKAAKFRRKLAIFSKPGSLTAKIRL